MRTRWMLAAGLAAALLSACDNADNASKSETRAEDAPPATAPVDGTAEARARDALGEAGDSARRTMENLGEAGRAGLDALNENAPEIREGLDNAGQRLRNAAGALLEDPAKPDVPGDSELDANETPESLERPPR